MLHDLNITLWGSVLVIGLYFLPSLIGALRDHHNMGAIFALNLLAGWTAIGWLVALVWSMTAIRRAEPDQASQAPQEAPGGDTRACPYCAEEIKAAAVVCRHCGKDLPEEERKGLPFSSG